MSTFVTQRRPTVPASRSENNRNVIIFLWDSCLYILVYLSFLSSEVLYLLSSILMWVIYDLVAEEGTVPSIYLYEDKI
jgi:hypothetical protein